jgi:aminomethyltransferase
VDPGQNALLKSTPLTALHDSLGARMVPFAGYSMPVQFAPGILKEHLHTRAAAGLFDVSHMGQVALHGPDAAAALERLVPGNICDLGEGRLRYTQFTNDKGGILDDLMVTNGGDHLFLVVNAACKDADLALLRAGLPGTVTVEPLEDRALIALQGPQAASALQRHAGADLSSLRFMASAVMTIAGVEARVSRSGYTGEDGFEISLPAADTEAVARGLLDEPEVEPIGLGARDSLRLEAGLCLYGHDIDTTTTPVEAALQWSIGKRRRAEGGFPGADVILRQLADGPTRRRVGIRLDGRAPAREGAELTDGGGARIGQITSGGFGPTVGGPVAMGYVETGRSAVGEAVQAVVRGRPLPAHVAALPFVEHRYVRG